MSLFKFSFSLETNRPIKKDEPDEFLEQAASTALSTVLKIIDDDNEQTQLNSTDIAINYKTYDSKNEHNQTTQQVCSLWPNLKSLSIWTQDQNNAIDWNYT